MHRASRLLVIAVLGIACSSRGRFADEAAAGLDFVAQTTLRSDKTGPVARSSNDRDGDGLTNAEEATFGTDPKKADTDEDGLLDGWEVKGVNGIDLKTLGADPRHKDVFIEMDFMTRATATYGLGPSATVIDRIVQAFGDAPVTNTDGQPGINVHLELGNEVPHDLELDLETEFAALKRANFARERLPVYHYMIWADGQPGGTSSGKAVDIPSSDFIVTLGKWNGGKGGEDHEKVGTFIHELGHNFGLKHGGSDDINRKPNHLSVMNYRWQTRGVVISGVARHYTYQPFVLPRLNEANLDESKGLSGPGVLSTYTTAFSHGKKEVDAAAAGAINWNQLGAADEKKLRLNINGDRDAALEDIIGILESTPNEWMKLDFRGGSIGSTAALAGLAFTEAPLRPLPPELTEEENELLNPNDL